MQLWRARSLGAARALTRDLLPVARAGFFLAVPMGLLLLTAETGAYVANPAFLAKMLLLASALVNVAWFHARLARAEGEETARPARSLRVSALLSALLWAGVVLCGRLIAYV